MAAALLLALASHPGAGAARGAEDESAPLDEPPDGEHRLEGLVGASDAMQTVYRMIRQVAPRDTTVLLLGESGTGKELAARALHERSDRNRGPFLVINCPSIPRELIESELFGHEKGAFTGALATRRGKIELAHEGTLFLDEVGDLAAGAQAKLLRFLEEREFQRVGGTENRTVNVRIVSATSRDLEEAMRQGAFREDLYYRLNVVPIRMPGLRERKEDIPLLVRHFLTRFSTPGGERLRIAGGALDLLRAYDWPGNVRELRNTLEYMIAIAGSERLDEGHLPAPVRQAAAAKDAHVGAVAGAEVESGNGMPHEGAGHGLAGPMRPGETLQSRLTRLEAGIIRRTLEEEGWNQSAAARRLGILESKIRHRMRHYGIRRPEGA